jgi:hypothetical protein
MAMPEPIEMDWTKAGRASASRGARMATDLIGRLIWGELIVTEKDLQRVRIVGLTWLRAE